MRLVDESRPSAAGWEDEGRRIGANLDSITALVVVASTPDDAAAVALGIGGLQAKRRRVVVADLAGDTATLARLVTGDDPHGLSDSFRYGVSLNRVAQRIGDGENLFVLPSGSEAVLDEEIYRSDRWRRLVAGFREVGALLILVAPDNAPALDALVAFTDGSVAVGSVSVPGRVIDVAVAPRVGRRSVPATNPDGAAAGGKPNQSQRKRIGLSRAATHAGAAGGPRPRALLITSGLVAAAVGAVMIARAFGGPAATAAVARSAADTVSAAAPRSVDSAAAEVAPDAPPIRNPGDSARAAAYGVELAKFSTTTGALMRVRDELPKSASAATFGVVAIGADATLWYRVIAGATTARSAADSELGALRRAKAIDDPTAGAVISVPFAFRLQADIAAPSARAMAAQYLARGVPAYALLQDDGSATIYAGAFETADQAALFMDYLRAAGIEPALTYRLGRTL